MQKKATRKAIKIIVNQIILIFCYYLSNFSENPEIIKRGETEHQNLRGEKRKYFIRGASQKNAKRPQTSYSPINQSKNIKNQVIPTLPKLEITQNMRAKLPPKGDSKLAQERINKNRQDQTNQLFQQTYSMYWEQLDFKKIQDTLNVKDSKQFKDYILVLVPIAIELKNKFKAHLVNLPLFKYKAEEILDILEQKIQKINQYNLMHNEANSYKNPNLKEIFDSLGESHELFTNNILSLLIINSQPFEEINKYYSVHQEISEPFFV
eukprot:TRINITY_DN34705_c0_g1_i1.p1 TRINITY_DN34705_c0_g1~~TRINITY_DN34705_c0_g1_i1.p1  ORF type:complete len:265 (+),score=24.73 TRINITY_DN34705_c0_g1_i1:46-840(+)